MPAPGTICADPLREARPAGLEPTIDGAQKGPSDACGRHLSVFSCSRMIMDLLNLPAVIDRCLQCSCRSIQPEVQAVWTH
jgi:hypothetical protein